jgi:hypothetical protein
MKNKGLQQGKISKQSLKLLCREGGELDAALEGSMVEKMRKGGDAMRYASAFDGTTKKQAYKMGGWVHSESKPSMKKYRGGGVPTAMIYSGPSKK